MLCPLMPRLGTELDGKVEMRRDFNRDLSIGTYVLIGFAVVGEEAVGFNAMAWTLAGLFCAFLALCLVAAILGAVQGAEKQPRSFEWGQAWPSGVSHRGQSRLRRN